MKKLIPLLAALVAMPAWAVDCNISYYSYLTLDRDGREAQAVREPALGTEEVTFTSTSVQTDGDFPAGTQMVRIVCDAKAHFEFGTNPTADPTDPFLAANTPEYFGVSTAALKIAFQDGN